MFNAPFVQGWVYFVTCALSATAPGYYLFHTLSCVSGNLSMLYPVYF